MNERAANNVPPANNPSSRWATLVPICLTLVVFACAFATGIASGLSGAVSLLPSSLFGYTAVISSHALGLRGHPYSGYQTVETALTPWQKYADSLGTDSRPDTNDFRNPVALNSAFRAASTVDSCGSPLVFNANNDQGLVDFIRVAFSVFGIDVAASYNCYFLLTLITITLFLIAFWRDYRACVLLFACACAVYAFMPGWIFRDDQLMSVANQRFLSTIGIIPLLHVLLLIHRGGPNNSWRDVLTAIGQTLFICFAYAIRSTSIWMPVAVAGAFALYAAKPVFAAIANRSSRAITAPTLTRAAVLLLVASTFVTVDAARTLYLTPPCGTALNAHPIWHSIYAGLEYGPPGVDPFNGVPITGDEEVFQVARQYVKRHHLPYQTDPNIWVTTDQTELTTPDAMPFGSWRIYDQVVRSAFLEFAWLHPKYVIESFFIYKPWLLGVTLRDFMQNVSRDLTLARAAVFAAMVLIIAAFWSREFAGKGLNLRFAAMPLLLLFTMAVSSMPSIVAYTGPSLIADQAYLLLALLTSVIIGIALMIIGAARALLVGGLVPRKRLRLLE